MPSSKKPRKPYSPKSKERGFLMVAAMTAKAHWLTPDNKKSTLAIVDEVRKAVLSGNYTQSDTDQLAYAAALYQALAVAGYGELQGKWLGVLCDEFEVVRQWMLAACGGDARKDLSDAQKSTVNDVLIGFTKILDEVGEQSFYEADKQVRERFGIITTQVKK